MTDSSRSKERKPDDRDLSGSSPQGRTAARPPAPSDSKRTSLPEAVAATRGRAVVVILAGMTEAEKSATSGAITSELGRTVDMIDLSRLVSKYIGETEKNLVSVFSRASDRGSILFFDEADALFGKRVVAKDGHDRYANVEVSHLADLAQEHGVTAIVALSDTDGTDIVETRDLIVVAGAS